MCGPELGSIVSLPIVKCCDLYYFFFSFVRPYLHALANPAIPIENGKGTKTHKKPNQLSISKLRNAP